MAFEWWWVTAGANAFMVIIYAWIAVVMIRGIHGGHQWRTNPIAVATAAVFVSCTIGHGLHLIHVIPPWSLLDPAEAAAGRAMFADTRLIVWDGLTAGVAIAYWFLRSRLAAVYQGASLSEDMAARQAHARAVHDRVARGLERAKASLDAGRREEGARILDETLAEAKSIITHLLGEHRSKSALGPGDLRRERPSGHP